MTSSSKMEAGRAVRVTIATALVFTLALTVGAAVQSFAQSQQAAPPAASAPPTAPSKQAVPDLPKVYMPGLGEFMLVIQVHHAKLWLAAKARNWPLATYQLSEMKEVFSDVEDLVPTYKSVPVGQMIEAITTGAVAELEKAVDEKNLAKFTTAYNKLTAACNDCHKAASRGFIQIRRPTHSTFANENFAPARK